MTQATAAPSSRRAESLTVYAAGRFQGLAVLVARQQRPVAAPG
jgi:hypothetical protein